MNIRFIEIMEGNVNKIQITTGIQQTNNPIPMRFLFASTHFVKRNADKDKNDTTPLQINYATKKDLIRRNVVSHEQNRKKNTKELTSCCNCR